MTWLWVRALIYMGVVGGGWLVVMPALLLLWESAGESLAALELRPWGWRVTGIGLFGVGVLLALWAGYCLIRCGGGTPLPLDPPRRLVTEGPYRYVRNPQGIAMTLMVMGEIIIVRSALLCLMLPLTLLYLEALVGPVEERRMERDFGAAYRAYASRVPKWLPRLRTGIDEAAGESAVLARRTGGGTVNGKE